MKMKVKKLEILKSRVDNLKEEILWDLIQELKQKTGLDFEPIGKSFENEKEELLRAETDLDYIYIGIDEDFIFPRVVDICAYDDTKKYKDLIQEVLINNRNL